jgi:hypothetical protein
MARSLIGWRTALGVSDAGQSINPFLPGTGWDVLFPPDVLNTKETEFEVYQVGLNGPVGSSVLVMVDGHEWNYVNQGWNNSYDPSQPLLLISGQTVQFCWTVAQTSGPYNMSTNIQPKVTLWLRRSPGVLT